MNKFIKNNLILMLTAGSLSSLVSCIMEDQPLQTEEESKGKILNVTAAIAEETYTRAYQSEGIVTKGTFYLSYPETTNEYNVAEVNFEVPGVTPGIGIVTRPGSTQELTWPDLGGGSTPIFYLDNVEATDVDESTPTVIKFDDTKNPYKAALFDSINGTNDLLWGVKQVNRDVKNVNFDLHHNMARVRVMVTVDRTNVQETEKLDVDNATVEITSLNQFPLSYDRQTGVLELDTVNIAEAYTTLKVVDSQESGYGWNRSYTVSRVDGPDPEPGLEPDPDGLIKRYVSQDFVIPPQSLLEDANRPQLVITMPDGDVYSGVLPHAMLIDNEISGPLSYPVSLYFLKEHILTIRTIITEDPPTLNFMPVWVVEWVDKGNFSLEAHQSGIYTAQEFYSLISYYQNNNDYQLVRYGRLAAPEEGAEEIWNFDFFSSVTLDYSQINAKMNPNAPGAKNFRFLFNNFGQFVSNEVNGVTEVKEVTAQKLYQIVTTGMAWNSI